MRAALSAVRINCVITFKIHLSYFIHQDQKHILVKILMIISIIPAGSLFFRLNVKIYENVTKYDSLFKSVYSQVQINTLEDK